MAEPMTTGRVRVLPRGGVVLGSSIGPVQYGAVPETIKDSMGTPDGVPRIYVVPPHLFALDRGILLAELEFPAFWNYFVEKKRTTVVCRPDQRRVLVRALTEACFGPRSVDADEFADVPPSAPSLLRELAWFRQDEDRGRARKLEDLVEWRDFDRSGHCLLWEDVEVRQRGDGGIDLLESGSKTASYPGLPPLPVPGPPPGHILPFRPPVLGVTVIGSGHGFDPGNRTSGFVIWIDGIGVLVDPPVDSAQWLSGYAVHPRQVDSLILTHCHADHDAGTMQKLLQEGRVTIYTTPTVMGSFVTKYACLLGMDRPAFRSLFDFVPVCTGEPVKIHGARVVFRYTLHSVPCVGFEVSLRGRSLAYSSDTLYDPQLITRLCEEGVLSAERKRDLLEFPSGHDLVLHEAGAPPIHTPVHVLASLDSALKERLLLVHTSACSLPDGSGLRVAPTGLENTIDLGACLPEASEALEALDAMVRVDIFAELPVSRAPEFVRTVRRETCPPGTYLVRQGDAGDRFYIILEGIAAIAQNGVELKTYSKYDYFGETALVSGLPRSGDVYACTDLRVLVLDRLDFLHLIRDTGLAERLRQLGRIRGLPSWELLSDCPLLFGLTASQKTQLQSMMEPVVLAAGTTLGVDPVLVQEGELESHVFERYLARVGPLGFAGDVAALRAGVATARWYTCVTEVRGFSLDSRSLRTFLRRNPGVYLKLLQAPGSHNPGRHGDRRI